MQNVIRQCDKHFSQKQAKDVYACQQLLTSLKTKGNQGPLSDADEHSMQDAIQMLNVHDTL